MSILIWLELDELDEPDVVDIMLPPFVPHSIDYFKPAEKFARSSVSCRSKAILTTPDPATKPDSWRRSAPRSLAIRQVGMLVFVLQSEQCSSLLFDRHLGCVQCRISKYTATAALGLQRPQATMRRLFFHNMTNHAEIVSRHVLRPRRRLHHPYILSSV